MFVQGGGEWFGYLDCGGKVTHTFKGGPYKGCFHVPRALFMCISILEAVLKDAGSTGSEAGGAAASGVDARATVTAKA